MSHTLLIYLQALNDLKYITHPLPPSLITPKHDTTIKHPKLPYTPPTQWSILPVPKAKGIKCKHGILATKEVQHYRDAPDENWKEIRDLWTCHPTEEEMNKETVDEIKTRKNVALQHIRYLQFHKDNMLDTHCKSCFRPHPNSNTRIAREDIQHDVFEEASRKGMIAHILAAELIHHIEGDATYRFLIQDREGRSRLNLWVTHFNVFMATAEMPFTKVLQISFSEAYIKENYDTDSPVCPSGWGNNVESVILEYNADDITLVTEELHKNQLCYPQEDRLRDGWSQSFLPVWGTY